MPKKLHFASTGIWKVCFGIRFNFTKIDPSYFFKREFFFIWIHLFLYSVNMVKKTNHQMLFVLVSNHPDFYLDGPILTSNKKKCTSKSINIVYQKMSYSILVKSMANMIHIIIVFILIQI